MSLESEFGNGYRRDSPREPAPSRGLGSVVIGGLALSTIFTLFLVPSLFSLTLAARETAGRLVGRG